MNRPTHTPAESTRAQLIIWTVALLALASMLAWFPTLRSPIPVAEDHAFFAIYESGYWLGLDRAFDEHGVWRLLGFSVVGFSANLHPLAYSVVALVTHLTTVCIFVAVCTSLFGRFRLAIGLGLCMASWPMGYQALVWSVCYPFVLSSMFFWMLLWVLLHYGDEVGRQGTVFAVALLLTLLGALSNECLLGASLATSGWLWLRGPRLSVRSIGRNLRTYYSGWGAFAAAALYVGGHYAFQHEQLVKEPGVFNPRSLLSAYYHTALAFQTFGVWTSPTMRHLGFGSWSASMTIVATFLGVSLVALAAYGMRFRLPSSKVGYLQPVRTRALVVCLLAGTSIIYAIGGGFSPESRKLYPIVFVVALAVGLLLVEVFPDPIIHPVVLALTVALSVPTAWLLTGVWRFEATRHQALARTVAEQDIHGDIETNSNPDPYREWPYLITSFGFPLHARWSLDYALALKFPGYRIEARDDGDNEPVVLNYNLDAGWSVDKKSISTQ